MPTIKNVATFQKELQLLWLVKYSVPNLPDQTLVLSLGYKDFRLMRQYELLNFDKTLAKWMIEKLEDELTEQLVGLS